jgi:anti-anti-sigma factor
MYGGGGYQNKPPLADTGPRTEVTSVHAAGTPRRVAAQPVVAVLRRGARTVARLGGDLDIAAAPALRERLRGLLRPGTKLLVFDLSGVSSCEVAGLAVLVGIRRWAAARGITVCLTAPGPQVAELLRITGLDRTLVLCATPADLAASRRNRRRAAAIRTTPSGRRPGDTGYHPGPPPALRK